MELKECITCGSHSFTGNKCDYCGNQYEVEPTWEEILEAQESGKTYCDDGAEAYAPKTESAEKIKLLNQINYSDEITFPEMDEISFNHGNTRGDKILGFMLYLLLSIVWFAVCVFIPPLFLITICGLIIWVCRKICKKY